MYSKDQPHWNSTGIAGRFWVYIPARLITFLLFFYQGISVNLHLPLLMGGGYIQLIAFNKLDFATLRNAKIEKEPLPTLNFLL